MNRFYLLTATALWSLWGTSWLVAAMWAGRPVRAADRSTYWPQLGLACLGFACLFVESPFRPHPRWFVGAALGWSGIAVVAAGLWLAWWARLHLGALWSGGVVRREGHRIVDTGPYALVRHPIYTALILGAAGLTMVKATPLALAGTGLLTLGFWLKARVEERFLADELGAGAYAEYRRRVPMLIPFARFAA